MKLRLIFTLALILAAAVPSPGQKHMSDSLELIKQLDKKLTNAFLKGDSALVEAILGDNYVEITAQGGMRRKADVMAEVRMRASAPPSTSVGPEIFEETKVSIHGGTAILIGLRTTTYQHMVDQTLPSGGQTSPPTATNKERFMKVFAKVGDHWQLVAFQKTSIAQGTNQTSLPD
jgi:hypothetical protein